MLTIDDMVLEEPGNFRCGKYSMIPYQHHQNKMIWKVVVIMQNETTNEDEPALVSDIVSIVAENVRKAAFEAIEQFTFYQQNMVECKEIIKEMKAIRKMERLDEKRNLQQTV